MKKYIRGELEIIAQNSNIAAQCGQDYLARTLKNAADFLAASKNEEQQLILIQHCHVAVLRLCGLKNKVQDNETAREIYTK